MEKIAIVGGGLAGSLVAVYLAKRGFDVHLFEKRPDMRKNRISAGRSINLALSVRGINALEKELNDKNIMLVPEERELKMIDLERKTRLIRILYQMSAHHDSKIDANAWDDIIQKDTLFLCAGKEYEFNFRAKDVLHSAYFPHFRAQMNTVPGMTTRFKFTPDITSKQMRVKMNDQKFNYILLCNKICGSAHYKMRLIVVVLNKNEYKKWMDNKEKNNTFRQTYAPVVAAPETAAVQDSLMTTPVN